MEHRFIADMMLGKLSRWMLLLGYDIVYMREVSDAGLVKAAKEQDRIILTRDTHLDELKPPKLFLLKSTKLWEQLAQVVKAFPLEFAETAFSRCSICNAKIKHVEKQEIEELLPPLVREKQHEIYQCPNCHKLYWHATHVEHVIRETKEKLGININKAIKE